jgi:sodium/bile acid cotransporter 7
VKKIDWFLVGLAVATALAWIFPEPGAKGGWLHPQVVNRVGIGLIFFLHGAAMSFQSLKAGTLRWPLHLVVQGTTFLLFPLIGLALMALLRGRVDPDLNLGFFYLCALPSTVSSSVAMTAAARGNVAAAIFNATLSSLIGVVLTPLWIDLVTRHSGAALPLGRVILDLIVSLVLPLAAGQVCRPWIGGWISRHKRLIGLVDRGTILLLVYTAFCDSVKADIWAGHGLRTVALVLAVSLALFFVALGAVIVICRIMRLPMEDRICAAFCGSKKTLASGVPMAQIIFRGHPGLGLIVLPIMIYHAMQLILCSMLASRWARRKDDGTAPA